MTTPGSGTTTLANFIDGAFVTTGQTFDNISPVDGSIVNRVHEAGAAEVDAAVKAARTALHGPWGQLSDLERASLLRRVAELIESRFDEFLAAEQADTGKPITWASSVDIPRAAGNFNAFAESKFHHADEAFHTTLGDGSRLLNYTHRRPLGVIAAIVPWNLPLLLLTWKVAPALACGNAIVVKPSEFTPTTATLLAQVMHDAGIPHGVFNLVQGFGPSSAGQYLIEHPDIDGITFTGGTTTGAVVMSAASKSLIPVSLELGGKNAAIVFPDADLGAVIDGITRSTFANAGQVCLCTERIYVHQDVFDEVTERLARSAQDQILGDPTDPATTMGPLIGRSHREKVQRAFTTALDEGATLVTGGKIPKFGSSLDDGAWILPTVLTGLPNDARTQTEEIFGPVCHVTSFAAEDSAIELVNSSRYGLAASVWSNDVARAHRVAQGLDTGIAWVNTWFARDLRTPFGGTKMSGIGREGGRHSIEFYTKVSNVCVAI